VSVHYAEDHSNLIISRIVTNKVENFRFFSSLNYKSKDTSNRVVMDTRLALCRLFCLLCLVCGMAAQAPQELKKTNDCVDQKTCGDCLAAGPPCGWCHQETYHHPERCDVVKNLIPNGCDNKFIMNPVSDSNFTKNFPPRNAESGKDAIQLSPQEVKIKLRPNEPYKFHVSFRQAENYPVDLYYVMDLSNSMEDDKVKLAELGDLLASKMSNITQNFRLGFGSFVDKKTMPYVSTVPEKLDNPCSGCAAPYGFLNKLPLTENTSRFRTEVIGAPISGNLDSPEGGFDAIMQAIACTNEIGWRDQSRKMLLFSTDAGFHYAGDGKLGGIVTPNDGHCHLDTYGEYTESLYQDYPSISQLAHKVAATKVNVIFAVTENQINVYRNLSAFIEGSTVGELANDSSNIVELVKDNYDKISSSIELKTIDAEDVIVKFKTKCLG
jgi:integrin beta 1